MGYQNVRDVFAVWGRHLDDQPMRLLLWMALSTYDPGTDGRFQPRLSTYSREALALALGHAVPDHPRATDPDAADKLRERHNAFQAVKRTIAALRTAGALTLINQPCSGRAAEYRLNLDPDSPDRARGRGTTPGRRPGGPTERNRST